MKLMVKIACVLFFTLLVGCAARKTKKQPRPKSSNPEQAAEQAHFTTLDGEDVAVSDYLGKVVLIDFWETWCRPCIKSMPALDKLQQKYPKRLKILAVTPGFSDTIKDTKKFVRSHDYHFTYAMDTNNLHKKLQVAGIPFKVFIDPQGKFIKKQIGSHGPKGDYRHIKKILEKYSASTPPSKSSETGK